MSAIAGISVPNGTEKVNQMLDRMAYRGAEGCEVQTIQDYTIGVRWTKGQPGADRVLSEAKRVEDAISDSHFASAQVSDGKLTLTRDPLGVSPLYYGYIAKEILCFASEVKALIGLIRDVREVPPGCSITNG